MKERTKEEILAKIEEESKAGALFNFTGSDLIEYLEFDSAKSFLKEGTTEEEWHTKPKDSESILKEMKDYMPFAWEKANGHRGLSAMRTMDHYTAWVWMLGDAEAEAFGDLKGYDAYGKENLAMICDRYGWDDVNFDDGDRSNS